MRIASFNINGIRAALKRGFSERMEARDCDVIGLQEVRCRPADLPEGAFGDRHVSWAPGSLAGRNGVALLTRTAPAEVRSWGTHLVMAPGQAPTPAQAHTGNTQRPQAQRSPSTHVLHSPRCSRARVCDSLTVRPLACVCVFLTCCHPSGGECAHSLRSGSPHLPSPLPGWLAGAPSPRHRGASGN